MKNLPQYLMYVFAIIGLGGVCSLIAQLRGDEFIYHITTIILGGILGFVLQTLYDLWSSWKWRDQNLYNYIQQGNREHDRLKFHKQRDNLLMVIIVLLMAIVII